MKWSTALAGAALLVSEVSAAIPRSALGWSRDDIENCKRDGIKLDDVDKLQWSSFPKLHKYLRANPPSNGCSVRNAGKRREWSSLSKAKRREYIDAVKCTMTKPSLTPPEAAPGARTRYDDFVALHINQTMTIHLTANFLSWHRYYIHAFEKVLREECGYQGYLPYWNWDLYADDLLNSALFDGSDSSLSGDGEYVEHPGTALLAAPPLDILPPANGGGCITEGPFVNMTVNLGPVAGVLPYVTPNPQPNGLGYNPRCLRRDINPISAAVTKANYTMDLITNNDNVERFQTVMQGEFDHGQVWGVHTGGHFSVGGDPGGDFFASSGDPYFYLHHGMIDRVWWIWQMQDLENRVQDVAGTITLANIPPSRNGTLDDPVDLGFISGPERLGDLLDTMDGPFCYIYV